MERKFKELTAVHFLSGVYAANRYWNFHRGRFIPLRLIDLGHIC